MTSESRDARVESIYEAIGGDIKRYLASRVRQKGVAEDLLQDVFLRIHKNIDSLKDIAGMQAWIFRIAHNVVMDHFRSLPREPSQLPDGSDIAQEPSPPAAHKPELSVRNMIEQLPEPYRDALLLTTYQGFKQQELANRAGITLSAAKSRVQRGRQMLKEMLLECCHFEFDRYGTLMNYEAREKEKCCRKKLHSIRGLSP